MDTGVSPESPISLILGKYIRIKGMLRIKPYYVKGILDYESMDPPKGFHVHSKLPTLAILQLLFRHSGGKPANFRGL